MSSEEARRKLIDDVLADVREFEEGRKDDD